MIIESITWKESKIIKIAYLLYQLKHCLFQFRILKMFYRKVANFETCHFSIDTTKSFVINEILDNGNVNRNMR